MFTQVFLLCSLIALSLQSSELGNKKSQELRDRVLRSSEDIIALNSGEYEYFVDQSPRPYDVIVFFTAPNCNMCDEVESELSKVAALYKKAGAIYPYKDDSNRLRAVYFVKVSFDAETRSIFTRFGFKSVPNILTSQPKMLRLRENEKAEHFREFLWQISMSDGTLTSQKLLEHVNKKTGRSVEYKESILNLLIVLVVFAGLLGVGVALFLKFRKFFINSKLWFAGSMTVYFICMSGIVYNIIHQVPFTNVDKNGNVEWFHSGARSQFGAEGYIMSGTISVLGCLFVLLLKVPSWFPDSNARLVYIAVFVLIYLVLRWLEEIYKSKSGFYSPLFWPPAHYQHGPLQNDQGNNI